MEQIIGWDPDVIVTQKAGRTASIINDERIQDLDVIKNNEVYSFPIGGFWWDRPSPEAPLDLCGWQNTIPEYTKGIDLKKETKEFYSTFYDYQLSDEEYESFSKHRKGDGVMEEHKVITPTRDEYIQLATSLAKFDRRTEVVSLRDSVGRVTAKDIYSVNTLPNQPTSAMDGIAVRFEEITSKDVDTTTWELGKQYVFSNTGVAIPAEYDTAIPIEQVEFDTDNKLHIKQIPSHKGDRIVSRGNIMKEGDLLVPANYLITPLQLGVLASGGIYELEVIAKPKVAIVPTGNELVPAGGVLPLGKNVETNSIVVETFVKEWGGEPIVYPIIPDDPDYIYDTLCHALKRSDMVIYNAGFSKGTHDFGKSILAKIGKVYAFEVAHGPAKHTSLTVVNDKLIARYCRAARGSGTNNTLVCKTTH